MTNPGFNDYNPSQNQYGSGAQLPNYSQQSAGYSNYNYEPVQTKSYLAALLFSIFLGSLGVDRFYLGHTGLGVAKLLLSWLTFGIWWLIDVILIATKNVKGVNWE